NLVGRYIEIRATFSKAASASSGPILKDLTVTAGAAVAAPESNAPYLAHDDKPTVFQNSHDNPIPVLANDDVPEAGGLQISSYSLPAAGTLVGAGDHFRY